MDLNQKFNIKNKKLEIFIFLICVFYILFLIFNIKIIDAQSDLGSTSSPQAAFLVSWKAINYVPADYLGKIFPGQGSQIEVGFDLIENGKVVDLARSSVSWYLDEQLISAGTGLKTVKFLSRKTGGNEQVIRISLNYRGETLDQIFTLPSKNPEVVLELKSPYREIKTGLYTIFARPFFFHVGNISNLNFNWVFNGQPIAGIAENPEALQLKLDSPGTPVATEINIAVTAQSAFNQLELAGKSLNLVVK